jgi:hypothetical protein
MLCAFDCLVLGRACNRTGAGPPRQWLSLATRRWPSIIRSTIRSRSNSANVPTIDICIFPYRVVESIDSLTDTKATPRSWSSAIAFTRWSIDLREAVELGDDQQHLPHHARHASMRRSRPRRSSFAPETPSSTTCDRRVSNLWTSRSQRSAELLGVKACAFDCLVSCGDPCVSPCSQWSGHVCTSCSALLMGVAAEPGQEGQGFIAGDQPTTTAAGKDTGREESDHDDAPTVDPRTVVARREEQAG